MSNATEQTGQTKSVDVSGRVQAEFTPEFIQDYKSGQKQEHSREGKRFKVEIATLIIVFIYTTVAFWQGCSTRRAADAARRSADAAADNAKAAKDTVEEMKKANLDTHDIAVQAGKQADAARSQADQSKAQVTAMSTMNELEKEIARMNLGSANIVPTGLVNWYRDNPQAGKLSVGIMFQNSGKTDATDVHCVLELKILDRPPTSYPQDPPTCKSKTLSSSVIKESPDPWQRCPNCLYLFESLDQQVPHDKYASLADRTLYAYGAVTYRDYSGENPMRENFCKRIQLSKLFKAGPGSAGTQDYENCP